MLTKKLSLELSSDMNAKLEAMAVGTTKSAVLRRAITLYAAYEKAKMAGQDFAVVQGGVVLSRIVLM